MGVTSAWQALWHWAFIPQSEFFWLYVISGVGLTLAFLRVRFRLSLKESFAVLCHRRVWLHRSTRLDLILSMFYAFFWFAPCAFVFDWGFRQLYDQVSAVAQPFNLGIGADSWPSWAVRLSLTGWIMICIDLASYVTHRAMHSWRWLWAFHAVHHATEQLNIFSTHRQHPVAPIMLNLVRGAFVGVGLGGFDSFMPHSQGPYLLFGLGAGFFVYMLTINLHHLHVPVSYPKWLRWILISPHVHHIHHSKAEQHRNKNFGVVFSVWDRLFGTYHEEELTLTQLQFGLTEDPYQHRLFASLFMPCLDAIRPGSRQKDQRSPQNPRESGKQGYRPDIKAAMIVALSVAIVGLMSASDLQSRPQINSITIVDEHCEQTFLDSTKPNQGYQHKQVRFADTRKPFRCSRSAGKKFSCFSETNKTHHIFETHRNDSRWFTLVAEGNHQAIINIDIAAGRFQVVATYLSKAGGLIAENCFGRAETGP